MIKSKCRQLVNLIMVLILISAPFEVLFANSHMAHDSEMTQSIDDSSSALHEHAVSMNGMADQDTSKTDQNCEKQCANCVFCSAVMLSSNLSNERLNFIYTTLQIQNLVDNIPGVDIRPPKYFTSL